MKAWKSARRAKGDVIALLEGLAGAVDRVLQAPGGDLGLAGHRQGTNCAKRAC